MNFDEEELLVPDKSQDSIRNQLSTMSFEELQTLKEKIGTKAYNATVFAKHNDRNKKNRFVTKDKDAPIEMSSKKPVSRFHETIKLKKNNISRDPRFDSLCGTFNETAFKNAYSFLSDVKKNDLKLLYKELKTTDDPEQIKKIKFLIQRLENKLKQEQAKVAKAEKEKKEKQEILEALKKGEKPKIVKKSDKKILNLVSQYEDLKNTGKLKKHINRIRKKNKNKDRKSLLK